MSGPCLSTASSLRGWASALGRSLDLSANVMRLWTSNSTFPPAHGPSKQETGVVAVFLAGQHCPCHEPISDHGHLCWARASLCVRRPVCAHDLQFLTWAGSQLTWGVRDVGLRDELRQTFSALRWDSGPFWLQQEKMRGKLCLFGVSYRTESQSPG